MAALHKPERFYLFHFVHRTTLTNSNGFICFVFVFCTSTAPVEHITDSVLLLLGAEWDLFPKLAGDWRLRFTNSKAFHINGGASGYARDNQDIETPQLTMKVYMLYMYMYIYIDIYIYIYIYIYVYI